MVKRPTIDYETVEKALLLRLHLALSKSKNLNTEIGFLARHIAQPVQLVRICAQRLDSKGLCEFVKSPDLVEHPETGQLIDTERENLDITEGEGNSSIILSSNEKINLLSALSLVI